MSPQTPQADVFFAPLDEASTATCLVLARDVRTWGVSAVVDARAIRIRRKFQWATDMRSYFAVIVGPDDIAAGVVQVKDLDERTQETVSIGSLAEHLARVLLSPDEFKSMLLQRQVDASNKRCKDARDASDEASGSAGERRPRALHDEPSDARRDVLDVPDVETK